MKTLVIFILSVICQLQILSAQNDSAIFYQKSLRINNTGMYVLGSWAIANLATGVHGWKNGEGANKYFHQMNFFWNTVNFSLATIALANNYLTDISTLTGDEMIRKHLNHQKLFLINGGLDLFYIGTGFGLREWSKNTSRNADRLLGYGNSVILQGGFLLLFDGIMYLIQHSHLTSFTEKLNISLTTDHLHVGLNIKF
ncbi:MAG: DUF6992 family protein [Bacteroidales bacterium]